MVRPSRTKINDWIYKLWNLVLAEGLQQISMFKVQCKLFCSVLADDLQCLDIIYDGNDKSSGLPRGMRGIQWHSRV
jgi:hypothetical protein